MGFRITTWNVNGIRNPFGYQPWRDKRTFEAMFATLEADIVVFQETKIQRKDLRDDMVLVPGWDNYWSLPKHKKGYSGVVVYTRNATCTPIRAEEGITGILTPPNSSTSFRDLPVDEQIGGYPNAEQLSQSDYDPATLDSEGRCVILEFPAFVLIGTYCPAERDETRTHFRSGFLRVLDARIRNLVKMGRRVIWTGDLNISREEIDTAAAEESMRKHDMSSIEWISTPARRMFNQLLVDGKVHGERDEGRETPIMWDICRGFHQGRVGMYTCWETKVNARPGNYGARIDYVVCSHDMKDWFSDSNIQEGLLGSDHCPVYAVLKDTVVLDGSETHILDLVNPAGMFENGVRKLEWTNKNLLPMSGKLIQEFDKRRSIKDMFTRQPSLPRPKSTIQENSQNIESMLPPLPSLTAGNNTADTFVSPQEETVTLSKTTTNASDASSNAKTGNSFNTKAVNGKRPANAAPGPTSKRSKAASQPGMTGAAKGQQSLKGFFAAKPSIVEKTQTAPTEDQDPPLPINSILVDPPEVTPATFTLPAKSEVSLEDEAATFAAKKSWGKLFAKPVSPKCEHQEPCKTMVTKKPGVNCGRSFWMCNRPLGPSGKQEKGTQWRCNTFIWASDWDTHTPDPP
ncbi:AP endonuclease 2 [Exophiala aquamarina CBS 119918]|uniref:DNA-(apurinic or apyrimidinic site) endonuclease 2 n=1 Tax=Exophiala aquamarina CBS 119918 TaxID=1182545 RepID=A0A072PHF5_9EURO|nr:AP endonuclease 2 [Exophiala aquamarina CBS 119918]KEF54970.1 AP endonuclease 2 [Exophiala aquamarina CBS 119918]